MMKTTILQAGNSFVLERCRNILTDNLHTMPQLKIWIHLVWTTKNRKPLLTAAIRRQVFSHIRENAIGKGIHIDFVNGYTDHVHCLISLKPDQCISKLTQLLKGESSYWINKNKLVVGKFEWQGEYFAASVSDAGINRVRAYIKNQEVHHKVRSFQQEYEDLMIEYGFAGERG